MVTYRVSLTARCVLIEWEDTAVHQSGGIPFRVVAFFFFFILFVSSFFFFFFFFYYCSSRVACVCPIRSRALETQRERDCCCCCDTNTSSQWIESLVASHRIVSLSQFDSLAAIYLFAFIVRIINRMLSLHNQRVTGRKETSGSESEREREREKDWKLNETHERRIYHEC